MALVAFNEAKRLFAVGGLDLTESPIKIYAMLVQNNLSAISSIEDAVTVSAISPLTEFVGTGYTANGLPIVNPQVNVDTAPGNDRAEFAVEDIEWPSLADNNTVAGMLLYHRGADLVNYTDSVPIAFYDSSGFPFLANGSNLKLLIAASGLLWIS